MSRPIRALVATFGIIGIVLALSSCGESVEGVYQGNAVVTTPQNTHTEIARLSVEEVEYNRFEGRMNLTGENQSTFVDLEREGSGFRTQSNYKLTTTVDNGQEQAAGNSANGETPDSEPETVTCNIALNGTVEINDGVANGKLCGSDPFCHTGDIVCVELSKLVKQGDLESSRGI